MRRLLGVLLVLLGCCAVARAESGLSRETLPSAVLGRPFPYMVYLPDGYQKGDLRYPVLYLLHGAGGDEKDWAEAGGIKATADRMMRNGEIQPSIIVMPGCRACWWVDGAADKAETAFWTELVPDIRHRYRIIDGRAGRLIAGLSAGGFGAVRFAMRYPDRVAAVAALSPAVYADLPPDISSARVQSPFLGADGAFDPSAWRAQNYPSLIDGYFNQRQRVAFYLVSGDNDRFGIAFETMTLFKRLWDRQPALAELRIVDGDHTWDIWSKSIENAMRYLFRHAAHPAPALVAASAGRTEIAAAPRGSSSALGAPGGASAGAGSVHDDLSPIP
jgi:S-formylglutathione hydrolase FrmB